MNVYILCTVLIVTEEYFAVPWLEILLGNGILSLIGVLIVMCVLAKMENGLMNECPICGKKLILPTGNKDSKVLIIGEFPGKEEMIRGMPFSGEAGDVLKKELDRNKVSFRKLRVANVWFHKETKAKSRKKVDQQLAKDLNKKCLNYFIEELLKEAVGKKAILLVGSESTKILAGRSVSEWAGLEIPVAYFDCLVMCVPNPGQVFHAPLGEVRVSIRKFCNKIKQRGYYGQT